MIGVIPKPGQLDVVEEFFQLFKTPWEFYRPEGSYTAVISTRADVSNVSANLLVLYGAEETSVDTRLGIIRGGSPQTGCFNNNEVRVPIYGDVCTFTAAGNGRATIFSGTEVLGVRVATPGCTVIRLGYDLFEEAGLLLSNAQPIEHAGSPTLDTHISMLRTWILEAGNPLLEIPPVPSDHSFTSCLTHDIDFIGIRHHRFDHTMFGFLYRATVGAARNLLGGKIGMARLLKTWRAAASLPLVYLGWVRDFWEPFEWYLKAEKNLPATYFLIPFKKRSGERVPGPTASRRATAYDVGDLRERSLALRQEGCELGVHGIDAWHSADSGRAELKRIAEVTGQAGAGIRMHWLLQDPDTASVLEEAGFAYDASAGYNETIGYRNGTTQVFRPLGARTLLELPLHIQDGALFFPQRLGVSESQAQERCQPLIHHAEKTGGVLTLLWHDRSHGPERFWGDFYLQLIASLKSRNVWFGTAGQVVSWFRKRREVRFERPEMSGVASLRLQYEGEEIQPPLKVRIHNPASQHAEAGPVVEKPNSYVDVTWNGKATRDLDLQIAAHFPPAPVDVVPSLS